MTKSEIAHARQLWSFHSTGQEITDPDSDVEKLYSLVAGYNPNAPRDEHNNNPTDKGVNEQVLLKYIHSNGAPIGVNGHQVDKIPAFAEVDPSNINDLKRTIHDCGVAYIGFVVPSSWHDSGTGLIWDFKQGDTHSDEGHAVVLTGWDQSGFDLISWGKAYRMTYDFCNEFVDEAYAITDNAWTAKTGKSLLSMSQEQLNASMMAF